MFEVEYKGANAVVISTKGSRLVIDPKLSDLGLKNVITKGSVELLTESRFAAGDPDSLLTIDSPGEYGVAGFDITGIAARRHIDSESQGKLSTIYRIELGESRIGVVGNIDKNLTDEQLERLGVLDVLIIPVGGGGYTLDATDAVGLVRMIGPKVVIPIHYDDSAIQYEVPQDKLSRFVLEMGSPVETVAKYKQKQSSADGAGLIIIELSRT